MQDGTDSSQPDAQKAIDDAAKNMSETAQAPPSLSTPPPAPTLPKGPTEPPPAPPTGDMAPDERDLPIKQNAASTGAPSQPAIKQKIVDDILGTPPVAPAQTIVVSSDTPQKKSSRGRGLILSLILLVLISLPIVVYYISRQKSPIADIRSLAIPAPGPYPGLDCTDPKYCRQWCKNNGGEEVSEPGCAGGGYRVECKGAGGGGQHYFMFCEGGDGGGDGGDGGQTPQCNQIKIYKDGVVVTELSSLQPNDQIVIAVAGGNATKARVRVNGGAWTETSTKNGSGEYTLNFTIIPESIVNNKIDIESEIFGTDNSWH